MSWFYLLAAGLFEVLFAISLKLMDGHKNIFWTVLFYLALFLSLYFLSIAMRTIPVGTAYAIWTGIGTAGVAIVGFLYFQEKVTFSKLFFLGLLLFSLIGVKLSAK